MNQFWIKYILRVLKIGCMLGLVHKTFLDYQNGSIGTDHPLLYTIIGIVVIVSSYINTKILKPEKMGEKRKLWIGYHHLKLAITLLLYLPIGKWIMSQSLLISLRMYWVVSIILVAPYMRFYRQHNSDKTRI